MNPQIDSRFWDLTQHLHRGGQQVHLWGSGASGKQSLWYKPGEQPDVQSAWIAAMDMYFTVNPCGLVPDWGVHRKSHKADIAAVNCLYAEFDDKDFAGNATGHASTLDPTPSVIVHSGGGIHAYWLLKDTYTITDDFVRECIDGIQKRWQALQGGDKGVNDLARVLRIPGTLNHKYTPARLVEIKEWHLDRLYDLAALEALLPYVPPPPPPQPATPNNVDDVALLEMARKAGNGAKFGELWAGNYQRYYANDHSTADLALCTFLAFWTGRDEARIDNLFRQSGLYRPEKWGRKDYRNRTIDKACQTVFSAYEPTMDDEAVKAAMSAVGLTRAHTNGHGPKTATAPVQPVQPAALAQGSTQPGPAPQRLADLEPEITKMLSRRMSREDKAELARGVIGLLRGGDQLLYDTITSQAYVQDEQYRVLGMSAEKQNEHLRKYLRSAGINSTEYTYIYLIEELTMAAMDNQTELQQKMLVRGDALYIPCGASFFVKATVAGGLEKLPNGTDGVYFIANSAIPEWEPVALADAMHPLALRPMQVAINTPPDAPGYTPEVQQMLLGAWLIAFFAGVRPLPLLATLGNKGGGKSMLLRSIMKLVMGQTNDLTTLTTDKRDYDTMVTNDLLVGLDNVDQLPSGAEWFFDSLATTATGGINKRRQYHTLAQQVNLPIVAAVMVSSRTASFARPDVAERTLPIFVRPFEDAERETDSALLAEIPAHRDEVLSWMAYHAINVLDRRPNAPRGLPARFQDFAQIVWAYCVTLGEEDAVLPVLNAWRNAQALSVGDADPLMRAIVEYISDNATGLGLYDLSSKDLISTLQKAGHDLPFMGGGKVIAQRLRELKGILANLGITLSERDVKYRPRFTIQIKS